MKNFAYKAVSSTGQVHKGLLTAENENELANVLGRKKLELIDAQERSPRAAPLRRRVKTNDDAERVFAGQMADLLRAGLPFSDALAVVLDFAPDGRMKDRLTIIEREVRAGSGVAEAFRRSEKTDSLALAFLKAGEQSGDLAAAFDRLSAYLSKQRAFRKNFLRAVRYPLFLLAVSLAATSFMTLWIVPQILSFLTNENGLLPLSTRALVFFAESFASFLVSAPPVFMALAAMLFLVRKGSAFAARKTDGWFFLLPFLGGILFKLSLARFTESLTLLLKSGLALPTALMQAQPSLANRHLCALCEKAHKDVLSGVPFSCAVAPLFPPFHIQMLALGEKSGQLPKTLEQIGLMTEKAAQESLDSFLGLLEPALTVFVGSLLAWIVLAVLGPLYGSLGQLSGNF